MYLEPHPLRVAVGAVLLDTLQEESVRRGEGKEVGLTNLVEAGGVALPGPHLASQHVVTVPGTLSYRGRRRIGSINIDRIVFFTREMMHFVLAQRRPFMGEKRGPIAESIRQGHGQIFSGALLTTFRVVAGQSNGGKATGTTSQNSLNMLLKPFK